MSMQLNTRKKRINPFTFLSKTVVWVYISLSMKMLYHICKIINYLLFLILKTVLKNY